MRVWHWEVHQEFQEFLHFYHFRVTPYDRELVRKQMLQFFAKQSLSGASFYETIGPLDILLRVWLVRGAERDLERHLRAAVSGVSNVFKHGVIGFMVPGVWKNVHIDKRTLRRLSEDQIRRIQAGKDKDLAQGLIESGLLREIPRRTDFVNFFINISPPEFKTDLAQNELSRLIGELCNEYEARHDFVEPWLYRTEGEQWAILNAKAADYFAIGKFVGEVSASLKPFGAFTTTFLADGNLSEESGDISEPTLQVVPGKDLKVAGLLPILYDQYERVSDRLRRKIRDWVRDEIMPAALDEKDETAILACLRGVARQDERAVRRALFDFFTDIESYLKAHWAEFVSACGLKQASMLRKAGVDRAVNPKFLGLSHLFTIFGTCLNESEQFKSKFVISGWDKVVTLRNKVMHGEEEEYEPLVTWRQDLHLLVEFMGTYRQLHELIERTLGRVDPSPNDSFICEAD